MKSRHMSEEEADSAKFRQMLLRCSKISHTDKRTLYFLQMVVPPESNTQPGGLELPEGVGGVRPARRQE